jgi:hypothetical protein
VTALDNLDALLSLDERLHAYQVQGVEHLWANPRAGLWFEPGLGKTSTALQALTPEHLPVLVVAPKRVAQTVWPAETEKWRPDLRTVAAVGTLRQRMKALESGADIVVMSCDSLGDLAGGHDFRTVIIDESSKFKTRGTNRWRHGRRVCREAAYVWELTGTPSPNGYMDLWAQIYLLDAGERLFDGIGKYRARWFRPGLTLQNGTVARYDLVPGAKEAIEEAIGDICLSQRAINHLDLPPVTHNEILVPLPPAAATAYEELRKELTTTVEDQDFLAANAAVATAKLSQLTAGFLYPDKDDPDGETVDMHTAKIQALSDLVDESGSPVLVAYRFRWEVEKMLAEIPEAEILDKDASVTVKRWNAGEIPVLLVHPASAGHGLNLQEGGHTIVWTTPTWSSEEFEQLNARLARQGQEHPVIIHHLIADVPKSVDAAALRAVHKKVRVQDALKDVLKR